MTMSIGNPISGGPPKEPCLVVACFQAEPWRERFCYFDGKRMGPGADNWVAAMDGLKVGERLPWHRRSWGLRGNLMYWRSVTIGANSVADELSKV